jgi:hypothetical protein
MKRLDRLDPLAHQDHHDHVDSSTDHDDYDYAGCPPTVASDNQIKIPAQHVIMPEYVRVPTPLPSPPSTARTSPRQGGAFFPDIEEEISIASIHHSATSSPPQLENNTDGDQQSHSPKPLGLTDALANKTSEKSMSITDALTANTSLSTNPLLSRYITVSSRPTSTLHSKERNKR